MKLAALSLTALSLALGLTLSNVGEAREGNESHGGGTENLHPNGPSWFMSQSRSVKACVVVGPNFRLVPDLSPRPGDPRGPSVLTKADATRLLAQTHDQWIAYMKERGILRPIEGANAAEFATRLEILPGCTGREDLRVYFGAEDEVVRAAKAKFKEPFGFALNVGKPESLLWRKGIIWISAPGPVGDVKAIWTQRRLRGELLHELGHTFGNDHVVGTVMAADLGRDFVELPNQYNARDSVVDEIDQARALVRGNEVETMRRRIDWGDVKDEEQFTPLKDFDRLMKRKHQGVLDLSATAQLLTPNQAPVDTIRGELRIADQGGARPFTYQATSPFQCTGMGGAFFHEVWTTDDFTTGFGSVSCQYVGQLTDAQTGESFPIAIELDSEKVRFRLKLNDGGSDYYGLFDFEPPGNTACEPNPDCTLITEPKP